MGAFLLPSFIGGLFPHDKKQSTSTTTPSPLSPQMSGLQDLVLGMMRKRLAQPSMAQLPASYETAGIGNINKTFDVGRGALENRLAGRGLRAGSPEVAAGMGSLEGGRLGSIVGLQNQIPLLNMGLQRDARADEGDDLSKLFAMLQPGRGTTTTGSSSEGGGIGGAFSSLAQMLGYLYGQGGMAGMAGGA